MNDNPVQNGSIMDVPEVKSPWCDLIRPDLHDYCPASNLAFNEKVKRLQAAGEKVYHFGFGQAPFPVMDEMKEALCAHAGKNAYLPVVGIPELREVICKFHSRHDKLDDLDPSQVIVGPGTKELIFLALTVFNGDVLVVSPTWTTYKPQGQLAGHSPYTVPTRMDDQWRVTPASIEQVIKENNLTGNKVLIICNPDNPTGTCYTTEHLKALSSTCRKHKIIVISDEIYARLHYKGSHDTLARYYPEGTILSSGMSKWASAGGWRLGYHIYPRALGSLMKAVCSAASHTYSCAPAPMQYAVAETLQNEAVCDEYILHTTRIMAAVADFCVRSLTSIGVRVVPSTAGYYIFPNFELLKAPLAKRGIVTGEQMCRAFFGEAAVALMAGGPAFLRPESEFTTRLCYVNFEGSAALCASRELGDDFVLDDAFVKKYCRPVHDGIMAICEWVNTQVSSHV